MAKVTYLDPNDDAPKVEWMGVAFRAGVPVEVTKEELLEAASRHPYFEVEAEKTEPGSAKPPGRPADAQRDASGRYSPEKRE